jgi:drug/metabolite transporter (DMT)-like permease
MNLAGLLRVAALALIWGTGFLFIKISLRGFTPVQLTFARLALGALVLAAVLVATRLRLPRDRRMWLHLTLAALFANALPYTLFGVAEQQVDSNLAGAINATTPLWTLLFAALLRQADRLRPLQWVGMILGFAGALLILSPWRAESAPLGGVLACLAASASYGISYVYMGRYLTGRGSPPIVLSAAQLIAASGLLLLATPLGGLTDPTWRPDAVIALLTLGIIGTGLAYVLNYRIITDDGPILASTVTYLLPVVAVIAGLLVLDEPIGIQLVSGVLVVLAGVALTRSNPRNRNLREGTATNHSMQSVANRHGAPDVARDILVGAAGGMLGNLLTAAVLYLLLVAGKVIPGNVLLTVFAALTVFAGLGSLLSVGLWAVGAFSNNYIQSGGGKRGLFITGGTLAALALVLILFFAARSTG